MKIERTVQVVFVFQQGNFAFVSKFFFMLLNFQLDKVLVIEEKKERPHRV